MRSSTFGPPTEPEKPEEENPKEITLTLSCGDITHTEEITNTEWIDAVVQAIKKGQSPFPILSLKITDAMVKKTIRDLKAGNITEDGKNKMHQPQRRPHGKRTCK